MERQHERQHAKSGCSRSARGAGLWLAQPLPGVPAHPHEALAEVFALPAAHALRAVHTRATLTWPAAPEVLVKRYAHGVWGDAWRDRLLRGSVRSCARREAENLLELARDGLPTPRALGWCGSDGWRGVRSPSALWMERIEHTATLRDELSRESSAAVRWRDELARLAALMHRQGWRHRDFYLQHLLIARERLVLIDVGRCEHEPAMRERWRIKDIAALALSCPASVPLRSRLRFAARYFKERGVRGRERRRAFLRAVAAKTRRMAAHQPRYVDAREAAAAAGPAR